MVQEVARGSERKGDGYRDMVFTLVSASVFLFACRVKKYLNFYGGEVEHTFVHIRESFF